MSVLHVERRTSGKPAQLRRRGLLPMVLVERNNSNSLIQATEVDLRKAMAAADGLGRLDLEIAGEKKPRKVMVKHIDKNFLRQEILCVTLVEVSADDVVKIDLPIVGINAPEDFEGHGLSLTHPTDHVKVRGKMSALPERIEVDLSHLEVGHHISAGDVTLPDGVELISSPDATLFSLQVLRAASLEPEVTAEPEAEEGEATEASEGE
ncbi:MAG TPA: 50S ribosomal protein L25 [Fimbriimonadaceae bacterium]|nr:50S ribosomal protein L25 [Fimbriimonadaceae bacterium]